MRLAQLRHHPGVSDWILRTESPVAKVFDHQELDHGFKHGNLDLLPLTGALPVEERGHRRVGQSQPADFVGDDRREEPGLARQLRAKRGHAAKGRRMGMEDIGPQRPWIRSS